MKKSRHIPQQGDRLEIPERFFSEVLPTTTNILELKTSLIILNEIGIRQKENQFLTYGDIKKLEQLGSLQTTENQTLIQLIDITLKNLIQLGVIFSRLSEVAKADSEEIYFLDDLEGRKLSDNLNFGIVSPKATIDNPKRSTTIFDLYENVIGMIPGAQIAQELMEAEKTYPAQWLQDAFDEAVTQDVRRWAYIRAILASWSNGGRGNYDGKTGGRNSESRYQSGKYGKIVRSK
ncbi:MAG: hypothetical protein ACJ0OL_04710 [Dehalococcoidia bacterium]